MRRGNLLFVISVIAVLWYLFLNCFFPMAEGRESWTYWAYFRDIFRTDPQYSLLMLCRTPATPLFYGLAFGLGGIKGAMVAACAGYVGVAELRRLEFGLRLLEGFPRFDEHPSGLSPENRAAFVCPVAVESGLPGVVCFAPAQFEGQVPELHLFDIVGVHGGIVSVSLRAESFRR